MLTPAGVAADLGHLERQCAVEGYVVEVGKNPIGYFEDARPVRSLGGDLLPPCASSC